jgi:glucose-1-phosphate thymidylyltransferase
VGENTEINYSIIKNSIVGSFTRLENVVLHSSLIGSDSSITGLSQSLNIGDNTEIDLRGEAK